MVQTKYSVYPHLSFYWTDLIYISHFETCQCMHFSLKDNCEDPFWRSRSPNKSIKIKSALFCTSLQCGFRLCHSVDCPDRVVESGQKVFIVTHLTMDRNRKWVPGFGAVLLIFLSHTTSALEVPLDRKYCPFHDHFYYDYQNNKF